MMPEPWIIEEERKRRSQPQPEALRLPLPLPRVHQRPPQRQEEDAPVGSTVLIIDMNELFDTEE